MIEKRRELAFGGAKPPEAASANSVLDGARALRDEALRRERMRELEADLDRTNARIAETRRELAAIRGGRVVEQAIRERRIESSECITCDTCLRSCPAEFGAIFDRGIDVVIIPELCSGCPSCVLVCPVDCIYVDENWTPTSNDMWNHIELTMDGD